MKRLLQGTHLLSLLIATASCVGNVFGPDETDRLADARERWSDLLIETYEIDFTRTSCECVPASALPVRVHVELDSITSAVRQSDDAPIANEDLRLYLTVEDVFDRIAEAIASDPFFLHVDYDADFGFPTLVELDLDDMTADDEVTYRMGDLDIVTTIPRNPQP